MYDEFSLVYDRFVNWQSRLAYEMPFIQQQLDTLDKRPGDISILDAACGTGMHVIELNQRRYRAAGADFSKAMILRAIENAVAFQVQAIFKTAGFGELERAFLNDDSGQPFDALLCLGNSVPHILTRLDLDRALRDFRACLSDRGFLLIQNRNFDAVLQDRQRWMEPQSHLGEDGEWVFLRFYDFEPDDLINFNIITLRRTGAQGWEQNVRSTRLRAWTSPVLLEALRTAGFDRITTYGNMEGAPFHPDSSPNLVIRAEPATD